MPSTAQEFDMANSVIHLHEIPTLRHLYAHGVLKSVSAARARFPPNDSFLDRVSLIQGDITKIEVDAIVNAANRSLLGGGGVDGAIHRAAGRGLLEECRNLGGCATGEAKITTGHKLPAKYIIHTVGPVYHPQYQYVSKTQLRAAYSNSLRLAVRYNIKSVVFPMISTGVYGYPIVDATHVALNETRKFLETDNTIERVVFTAFTDVDWDTYRNRIPLYFPAALGHEAT